MTVGEIAHMQNPIFKDGTRLRIEGTADSGFNGQHILNDAEVEVRDVRDDFVKIRLCGSLGSGERPEGWVRERNVTRFQRMVGLKGAKQVPAKKPALQRSATISSLQPTSKEELKMEDLGSRAAENLERLMAINGTRWGTGDEGEKTRAKSRLNQESFRYRRQLKRKQGRTLDPHSRVIQRWDMVTTVALLFTASVTPFEVCILEPTPLHAMLSDPLSWVNRVVDIIFVVDIVLQCFIAYQESPEKGGAWITDNKRIIYKYASSWLTLDVLTAIPIDVFIAAYEAGQPTRSTQAETMGAGTNALRIIRMLRLLKLVRVIRASRIFRRWQAHLGISFAVISLIKFVILTLVNAHWLACLWVLIGRVSSVSDDTPSPDPHLAFGTNWIHKAGLTQATPNEIYSVALYVAFSSIFSGSGGTVVPASPLEYYFQTLMMLVGSSIWAYVISSGCGIIATLNPNGVHYRHMMDELNYFAIDKKLPREMTVKLREFFSQTQHVHRQRRYEVLFDSMSSRLKADAALCWARGTLMRVSYFSGKVEGEFLASAALTLTPRVFCRSEYISVESLLIIERGIAAKDGRIAGKGATLGEDMVLNSLTFRDLDPAIALTFVVHASCLQKKAFETLLADYPVARSCVRHATFKLAFCRAVIQVAKVITKSRSRGLTVTILEAFVSIRQAKELAILAQMRNKEPSTGMLSNNLIDLAERAEAIALNQDSGRENIDSRFMQMEGQVKGISTKLDTILQALAPRPESKASNMIPPGQSSVTSSSSSGWLSTWVGEATDASSAKELSA